MITLCNPPRSQACFQQTNGNIRLIELEYQQDPNYVNVTHGMITLQFLKDSYNKVGFFHNDRFDSFRKIAKCYTSNVQIHKYVYEYIYVSIHE